MFRLLWQRESQQIFAQKRTLTTATRTTLNIATEGQGSEENKSRGGFPFFKLGALLLLSSPIAAGKLFKDRPEIAEKVITKTGVNGEKAVSISITSYQAARGLFEALQTTKEKVFPGSGPKVVFEQKSSNPVDTKLQQNTKITQEETTNATTTTTTTTVHAPKLTSLEEEAAKLEILKAEIEALEAKKKGLLSSIQETQDDETRKKLTEELSDSGSFQAVLSASLAKEQKAWQDRIEMIREEHVQALMLINEQQKQAYLDQLEKRLKAQEEELRQHMEQEKSTALNEQLHQFNLERITRLADIEETREKIQIYHSALSETADYYKKSHQVHQIALASGVITNIIDQGFPLSTATSYLNKTSAENEVVQEALKTIDAQAVNRGVSTHTQLANRFEKVISRARHATLVPKDSGIYGEILAFVSNLLTLRQPLQTPSENDSSPEAILLRAERFMRNGDLAKTVLELEKLEGREREVVGDWVREARSRVVAQQALQFIHAEASTVANSLS